jgi:hypothetical protein
MNRDDAAILQPQHPTRLLRLVSGLEKERLLHSTTDKLLQRAGASRIRGILLLLMIGREGSRQPHVCYHKLACRQDFNGIAKVRLGDIQVLQLVK